VQKNFLELKSPFREKKPRPSDPGCSRSLVKKLYFINACHRPAFSRPAQSSLFKQPSTRRRKPLKPQLTPAKIIGSSLRNARNKKVKDSFFSVWMTGNLPRNRIDLTHGALCSQTENWKPATFHSGEFEAESESRPLRPALAMSPRHQTAPRRLNKSPLKNLFGSARIPELGNRL